MILLYTVINKLYEFIKIQACVKLFVDVLANAAAFVGTTVHQVSLQWTVSNHRYESVGRTPRLGSSTCLVIVSFCKENDVVFLKEI